MATTYKICGERQGAQFRFDVAIGNESSDRGRWRLSSAKGLGPLGPALAPGGKWQYRKRSSEEPGYLFLKVDGRGMPFDIALKDVADDFFHGPFCSVDSGTGTLSASVEEDIPIEWEIAGPGCV